MTPTDDLHQLIKSLNASEKRYFKVWATKNGLGEASQYQQLYAAFDNLPVDAEYNQDELIKNLEDKQLIKNFAREKNRLLDALIKAMRAYHSEKTIENEINNLLLDEEFFKQKRLGQLQEKAIEKAKKLAYKYEQLPSLITVLQRELSMQIERQSSKMDEAYTALNIEEQEALNRLQTLAAIRYFSYRLFILLRTEGGGDSPEAKAESLRIINEPIIKRYQPGQGHAPDFHYYRIFSMHHRLHRNMKEFQKYTRLMFELYEIHYPQIKEIRPKGYKIALYNYLNACFRAEDFEPFPALLAKAKEIKPQTVDEEAEDWQNMVHLELLYHLNTGQVDKAMAMAPEILRGTATYLQKVNKSRELTLYYNMATAFFIGAKWGDALDLCNKILQEKSDTRQDLKQEAELLSLASHVELQNFDLAEYQLRNLERRYATLGKKEDYKPLFQYLRSILKNNSHQLNGEAEELYSSIKIHPELIYWVKSKQEDKTIRDLFLADVHKTEPVSS